MMCGGMQWEPAQGELEHGSMVLYPKYSSLRFVSEAVPTGDPRQWRIGFKLLLVSSKFRDSPPRHIKHEDILPIQHRGQLCGRTSWGSTKRQLEKRIWKSSGRPYRTFAFIAKLTLGSSSKGSNQTIHSRRCCSWLVLPIQGNPLLFVTNRYTATDVAQYSTCWIVARESFASRGQWDTTTTSAVSSSNLKIAARFPVLHDSTPTVRTSWNNMISETRLNNWSHKLSEGFKGFTSSSLQ